MRSNAIEGLAARARALEDFADEWASGLGEEVHAFTEDATGAVQATWEALRARATKYREDATDESS